MDEPVDLDEFMAQTRQAIENNHTLMVSPRHLLALFEEVSLLRALEQSLREQLITLPEGPPNIPTSEMYSLHSQREAWTAVANHPALNKCYGSPEPLMYSVLKRLTELHELEKHQALT